MRVPSGQVRSICQLPPVLPEWSRAEVTGAACAVRPEEEEDRGRPYAVRSRSSGRGGPWLLGRGQLGRSNHSAGHVIGYPGYLTPTKRLVSQDIEVEQASMCEEHGISNKSSQEVCRISG